VDCKFITNGVAIDYSGLIKPCCIFKPDVTYKQHNHIQQVDLATWHQTQPIQQLKNTLADGQWPESCKSCKDIEQQGRGDSMRLNGLNSYGAFDSQDITLEIRPGNVCNFACQTCWPAASSRVTQFYKQADMDFVPVVTSSWDYQSILPLRDRIKNVVILGGEPFYDKSCLALLEWMNEQQFQCDITMFTNGSTVKRSWLENYQGRITLVFSIDAVGTPGEYIRFGSAWEDVEQNYQYCKTLPNVDLRINITTSFYNYLYLDHVMAWIIKQGWPEVVSFGRAETLKDLRFFSETVIPAQSRPAVLAQVARARQRVDDAVIEPMQKSNALATLDSIVHNLAQDNFDAAKHQDVCNFIKSMDQVKHVCLRDYCPDLADALLIN
jgi:sulfatase maturation enzyme AslB (radical SAM superfamily)